MSTNVSKVFQHADDTTLTLSDKQSITEVFSVLKQYGNASGAKVNKEKSELLCIGRGEISIDELQNYESKLLKDVILILDVYLGADQNKCDAKNWCENIKSIKRLLNLWHQRHLTVQGRATVISSPLLSKCWHVIAVTTIPEHFKRELKSLCVDFMWNKGAHLVAYNTISMRKKEGGVQLPDIDLKLKAFRIKFVFRLLDNNCNALWKNTCQYFLSIVENMNLGMLCLYCYFSAKQLVNIPIFYREMLLSWRELNVHSALDFSYNTSLIYSQPLFSNPLVCENGKMLVNKHFIAAGLRFQ